MRQLSVKFPCGLANDVVREKLRNVLLGPMGRTIKIKTQFLQCEICTQYSAKQPMERKWWYAIKPKTEPMCTSTFANNLNLIPDRCSRQNQFYLMKSIPKSNGRPKQNGILSTCVVTDNGPQTNDPIANLPC